MPRPDEAGAGRVRRAARRLDRSRRGVPRRSRGRSLCIASIARIRQRLRDLLDLTDTDVAALLPSDDDSDGFDNVGAAF